MEHGIRQQSGRSGELSPKNSKLAIPMDEIRLLSSCELASDSEPPSSDNLKRQPQRPGVINNLCTYWGSYKSKPWNMCLLLVLGTVFALGHHLFYSTLDGKAATDQSLMLRYGTILAFCAKASLGTAAAIAFQQRAWLVLRHKTARLNTVDSIFTANTDIFSLLTWSSINKAKIGTLIAVYCWITPLVVVLTSETLSVVVGTRVENGTCPNVRTLNFSNEEIVYWRTPWKVNDRFLMSVSLWNTTAAGETINLTDSNEFDYFTGSSQQWDGMIASRVVLSNEPLVRKETGQDICSTRWNCSYVISFVAPGYKCEELASGVNSEVRNLGQATPPFNTSALAPMGNYTYYAKNHLGDYHNPQILSSIGGRPKQKPPYPKNLGAFRTEPIMWIGYSTVKNYSKPQPPEPRKGDWYKAYTPVIIGCEHYEVKYTIKFDFVEGVQSHKILHRKYLRKVINTTFTSELDQDKRLKDRTKAIPEKNYVYPLDIGKYRLTAAYHSLGYTLRRTLNGTTTMPHFNVNSDILITPLVDRINYLPVENFRHAIMNMYENMVLSLLSDPSFSVVSWASNGKPSGPSKGGAETAYPCRKEQYINVFSYSQTQLLAVYAASIALAVAAVLLGLQAYREEGRMRDMKPSSIIAASRASNLHE
ncbi:hypothetical protein FG05_30334 [Fusarium graminearum]|nr:hypothetical protein FG05_30334 [Fusarium graminearum]